MKTKIPSIAITILVLNVFFYTMAQTGSSGIAYTYDASGNRTHRAPATSSERKAAPGTEEKKDEIVVSKNNLQASFTPNPTASGIFTVVISRCDNKSPDVHRGVEGLFIYNPLGELIHQESTQYNTQAIINLSAYSKGIYIVKVQSGEEVLMHRMAYQ